MKKYIKILPVVFIVIIVLSNFNITAFASSLENNGLEIQLTTDKEEYSLNEDIKINTSISNKNDFAVEDLSVETILPDNFIIKEDNQNKLSNTIDIDAGDEINFSFTASVINDENNKEFNINNVFLIVFIVLFLASIATLIFCLTKHFKKTTKIISVVLCVVIAVISVVGIICFQKQTEDKFNFTNKKFASVPAISLSEKIKVNNIEYYIISNLQCKIFSFENDTKYIRALELTSFYVDDYNVMVGKGEDITFFAKFNQEVTNENLSVYLYCEDELIGELYNNGSNGDEIANDNLFSSTFHIQSDEKGKRTYHIVGNEFEKGLEISFYEEITEKQWNDNEYIRLELDKIQKKYTLSDGYVDYDKVQDVLNEAVEVLRKNSEKIENYKVGNNSISIVTNGGITILFTPKTYRSLAGGSTGRIVTLEPSNNFWNNFGSGWKQIQAEIDGWANNSKYEIGGNISVSDNVSFITDENSNYNYFEDDKIKDKEVTLNQLKNLGEYSILIFEGHGGFNECDEEPALITGEKVTKENKQDYCEEIASKKLYMTEEDGGYYAVTSSWIKENMQNSNNYSFVFLGSCHSLQNDKISDAFLEKGAFAVVGYDNKADIAYEKITRSILFKCLTLKSDSSNYPLVEDTTLFVQKQSNSYLDDCKDKGKIVIKANENYDIFKSGLPIGSIDGKGTLKGQFVDNSTGNSINNVKMECRSYGNNGGGLINLDEYRFNINGKFSYDLPVGYYRFVINADGYEEQEISIDVRKGKTINLENITLYKSGTIVGFVKDNDTNNPIKYVKVEFIDNSSDSLEPVATAITDEKGNFNLNLPQGEYSLSFNHDKYEYYGITVTIDSDYVVLEKPILLKAKQLKMTDFLGMTFGELIELYGTDYIITDTSGWIPSSPSKERMIGYNEQDVPFDFLIWTGREKPLIPYDNDEITDVSFTSSNSNKSYSIDGIINTDIRWADLQKKTNGIKWIDNQYYAYSYTISDIAVDFQYESIPTNDTIADYICISNRDWKPENENWSTNILYQPIIEKYRSECEKSHSYYNDIVCCTWFLFDVDDNGVDELIIQDGGAEQARYHHYFTISNDEVIDLGKYSSWHMGLYEKDRKLFGKVVSPNSPTEFYQMSIVNDKVENKLIKTMDKSEDNGDFPVNSNPIMPMDISYDINEY